MPFGPLLSLRHPHGLPLVTVVAVVPDLCRLTGLYSADEVLEGLLIRTVAVAVHIVTLSSNRQTVRDLDVVVVTSPHGHGRYAAVNGATVARAFYAAHGVAATLARKGECLC